MFSSTAFVPLKSKDNSSWLITPFYSVIRLMWMESRDSQITLQRIKKKLFQLDWIIACYDAGLTQHFRLHYREAAFIIFYSRAILRNIENDKTHDTVVDPEFMTFVDHIDHKKQFYKGVHLYLTKLIRDI